MSSRSRQSGFTLLEAMVALTIVALGMMAVNTQLNRYAVSAVFIEEKTLASWIASNVLAELSVEPQWPSIGTQQGDVEFASRQWVWEAEIMETQVENLRRVDVVVALEDDPDRELHRVSGLLEPPPPPGFVSVSWLTPVNSFGRPGIGGMAGTESDGDGSADGAGDGIGDGLEQGDREPDQ
jgi:general secretion pathway protein I